MKREKVNGGGVVFSLMFALLGSLWVVAAGSEDGGGLAAFWYVLTISAYLASGVLLLWALVGAAPA